MVCLGDNADTSLMIIHDLLLIKSTQYSQNADIYVAGQSIDLSIEAERLMAAYSKPGF